MSNHPDPPKGLILGESSQESLSSPHGADELPADTGPGEKESQAFGAWLRGQREMRSISLREVADASKISFRYLQALEEEKFEVLPGAVFARGFLRQYARYVGLDPDDVINFYLAAQDPDFQKEESSVVAEGPPSSSWATGLVLAVLVIAFLVIVLALSFRARRDETLEAVPPPIVAPTPSPAVIVEETPPPLVEPLPPVPEAPLILVLDFLEDCWVETRADEEATTSQLYVQGESLRLLAQQKIVLKLGKADGVRAELNGKSFELAPDAGGEVAEVEIDLETAAALAGDLEIEAMEQ